MELLLFRPSDFERLYLNQCSRIHIDDIPLEQRIRPINGTIFIFLFIVVEILYIPCIFAIWKRVGDNSCYKFLFYVGVTDMIVLWVCGFFTGYFALKGAVFCSDPILNYVLGLIGMNLWFAESIAELFLAIDRCLEMTFPQIADRIFGGKRAWLWIALISVYSTICFFFSKAPLFSSIYCSWFFQPLIGYVVDSENLYANYLHSTHDIFMAIAFPFVYLLLGLRLAYVSHQSAVPNVERTVSQRKMFLQVAIISAFNCYSCLLYVAMQYIEVTEFHILMAQYGWFFIHGIPPFIYLTINKTIRNDCRKMIASSLFRMANQLHAPTSAPVSMVLRQGRAAMNAVNIATPAQIHPTTKSGVSVEGADRVRGAMKEMIGIRPPFLVVLPFFWKFTAPLVTIGLFIFSIVMYKPLEMSEVPKKYYPTWAQVFGFGLSASSMVAIPAYALYYMFRQGRDNLTPIQRFLKGIHPPRNLRIGSSKYNPNKNRSKKLGITPEAEMESPHGEEPVFV